VFYQGGFGNPCFIFGIEGFEDTMVFTQPVVRGTDHIFTVLVQRIIMCITAGITTEFLICATYYFFTAFGTGFVHTQS
jgi:hypothetical protein